MSRCILLVVIMGAMPCAGQDFDKYFSMAYDWNIPVSNREFIDKTSTRGAKIIYRQFIGEKFSVGGELGFSHYNDYLPPQVYTDGNRSIFTDLYGYSSNYSLTVSGEYFLFTDKVIMPYAGFGLGAAYNKFTALYNIFGDEEKIWGALLRPNIGALVRFGKKSSWGILTGIHLDYATTKSKDFEYKNFSNLGFQLGLVYLKR